MDQFGMDLRGFEGEADKPSRLSRNARSKKPEFLEFFAGSGLVAYALKPYFQVAWANDISHKKAAVYTANHDPDKFNLGSIEDVKGTDLPDAILSWASFPCQDLSLAGLIAGINGDRSGLVWAWLRIMDEMAEMPPILVAENVTGLVSINGGAHYRALHDALRLRGYRIGAIQLDAVHWLPQSRPRVFVIAVKEDIRLPSSIVTDRPTWMHPLAVTRAAEGLESWIWWNMPQPPARKKNLIDIVEWDAPCHSYETVQHNLSLIPPNHLAQLKRKEILVAPGYKRTRSTGQMLELRFDGVAGCLRTPKGGSSRQVLVLRRGNTITTRLLTVRETARLMGAPEKFKLPGSYNDGYMAMGDAVAAPVARYLARYLLAPLSKVAQ